MLKQVTGKLENYLTFYSFDIYFNVSTGGRQDFKRSNAGNSIIIIIIIIIIIFSLHTLSEMLLYNTGKFV